MCIIYEVNLLTIEKCEHIHANPVYQKALERVKQKGQAPLTMVLMKVRNTLSVQ